MATRERSIWAWGWRDKLPDDNARTGLAAMVRALVPGATPTRAGSHASAPARSAPRSKQSSAHGLTLRHFPQSFELSTLGSWLATRAGGHYATGPTHIDDHAHALTMITPRGTLETHRHPASRAGPEASRLVLGSEGALGVITEAWIRVVPRVKWRASASAAFADFADGVRAARALAQSGLSPSNARLLDANEAHLHRVRFDGTSVLLVGFESADHPMSASLARAVELVRDGGGTIVSGPSESADAGAGGAWKQAFLDAPYRRVRRARRRGRHDHAPPRGRPHARALVRTRAPRAVRRRARAAAKAVLDPHQIMNPGVLV